MAACYRSVRRKTKFHVSKCVACFKVDCLSVCLYFVWKAKASKLDFTKKIKLINQIVIIMKVTQSNFKPGKHHIKKKNCLQGCRRPLNALWRLLLVSHIYLSKHIITEFLGSHFFWQHLLSRMGGDLPSGHKTSLTLLLCEFFLSPLFPLIQRSCIYMMDLQYWLNNFYRVWICK